MFISLITFLFKDVGLVVEFSAFELMMFFGALQRMPLKKIRERIHTLIELLEIPSLYQRIETMRYVIMKSLSDFGYVIVQVLILYRLV